MARLTWLSFWLDGPIPAIAWRPMWTFSRNRMGFVSKAILFFYPFLPHLCMAWGMVGVGFALLLGWPFGLKINDMPNALGFLLIPFGGIFCAFLTPLILGRKAVKLNREKEQVVQLGGIGLVFLPMLPLAWKRRSLRDFEKVTLTKEWIKSYENFVVRLHGEKTEDILIVESGNELHARNLAEKVAAFIGMPLEDKTAAEPLLKDVDKLNEPLGERALRTNLSVDVPRPPKRLLATYSQENGRLLVTIERPPFDASLSLKSLLLCAVLAVLCFQYQPQYPEHPYLHAPLEGNVEDLPSVWPWRIKVVAFHFMYNGKYLAAVCAGLSLLVLIVKEATRPYGYRIMAGADGLNVWRSWAIFRRRFRFTRAELEDLRLEPGPSNTHRLAAFSDRRILRFAETLPREELDYLREMIVRNQASAGAKT